jgi:hypothetical protein
VIEECERATCIYPPGSGVQDVTSPRFDYFVSSSSWPSSQRHHHHQHTSPRATHTHIRWTLHHRPIINPYTPPSTPPPPPPTPTYFKSLLSGTSLPAPPNLLLLTTTTTTTIQNADDRPPLNYPPDHPLPPSRRPPPRHPGLYWARHTGTYRQKTDRTSPPTSERTGDRVLVGLNRVGRVRSCPSPTGLGMG